MLKFSISGDVEGVLKGMDRSRSSAAFGYLSALLVFAVLLFVLGGCAPAPVTDEVLSSQGSMVWPEPPATARISYVRTISRGKDVGARKGLLKRMLDVLLGEKLDNMIKPYGVTVDSAGRLLVVDTAFKRVHIFDVKNHKYQFINDLGSTRLVSPIAVAVDSKDNIYVTDSVVGKVFVYNKRGGYLSNFKVGKRPTGIAINKEKGRIYVVDTAAHRVKVFSLDGKRLKGFGRRGAADGQFNLPVDIFLDRAGDVYVVDTMNYKVKIFDSNGKFLTSFGTQGDGTGDFGRPKGIAVDRDGNIYVADAIYDTVQIFNRKGRFLLNFGTLGQARGSFWMPTGLFVDPDDRIYVADSYNKRVQVFEYLSGSSLN